jgi:hypothetical protein
MKNGLAERPWRAFLILAAAFLLTYAGTFVGEPAIELINDLLWDHWKLSLSGGYSIYRLQNDLPHLYFTLKYSLTYLLPFAIVVVILTRDMPGWFAVVLGILASAVVGLFMLATGDHWFGYRSALRTYISAQASCGAGAVCVWLYRHCVSVPQPEAEE